MWLTSSWMIFKIVWPSRDRSCGNLLIIVKTTEAQATCRGCKKKIYKRHVEDRDSKLKYLPLLGMHRNLMEIANDKKTVDTQDSIFFQRLFLDLSGYEIYTVKDRGLMNHRDSREGEVPCSYRKRKNIDM